MTDKKLLYNELLDAHQKRDTGKFLIYCKANAHSLLSARPGEIDISGGEIVSIRYAGQAGDAAFGAMLGLVIDRVVFLDSCKTADSRDAATPSMADVLSLMATGAEREDAKKLSSDLVGEVQGILAQLYGANVTAKLKAIAAMYPPDRQPMEFLKQCQQDAATMLGESVARNLFAPLTGKFTL